MFIFCLKFYLFSIENARNENEVQPEVSENYCVDNNNQQSDESLECILETTSDNARHEETHNGWM